MPVEFGVESLETSFQEFRPLPEQQDPSVQEVFGAAFRQENDVVNAFEGLNQPRFEDEENHNPLDVIEGTRFENYLDSFVTSRSLAETEFIKQKIEQEERDRQILADGGTLGLTASITAGIVSPTTLLPGGVLYRGTRAGQAAFRTGRSTALAGGSAVALQEAVLQDNQETRTLEESAINVGTGALLSGILGGSVAGVLSTAERKTLERSLDDFQDITQGIEDDFVALGNSSVGAAQRDIRDARLKDEAFIKKLKGLDRQDPTIRLKLSESQVSRRAVNDLTENPLENVENAEFIASTEGGSVESRMKTWQGPLADSLNDLGDSYSRYFYGRETGRVARSFAPLRSELTRHGKLTYHEFKSEVGKALRRGDVHEIPEVQQAAQSFRSKVFEPGKQQAINAGLLDADVDVRTAQSYLTRVYNHELIEARRGQFKEILQRHFEAQRNATQRRIDEIEARGDKLDDKLRRFADYSNEELASAVEETIEQILGNAPGRTVYDLVQGPRGPLRERVLNIADSEIEEFLESDIEMIGRFYTNTMAADVEITNKFGDVDLETKITEITEDFNKRIDAAKEEKTRRSLEKRKKADIRDVRAIRDRLRGTYALPDNPSGLLVRTGRAVRSLNFLRLLGGMTISAIPDLAKPVFVHGLSRTLNDGIAPMLKNINAWKLSAEEVKLAGTALDLTLDTRTMAIADLMDNYGRHSKFERLLNATASKFGIVSLMAPWNATLKQFAGNMVITRMLRAVTSKNIDPSDIKLLAASGIDEPLAARIAKEFKAHGSVQDGIYLPNTSEWTDDGARRALRAAIVRDVDRVVVTPGQDKPLWMSNEVGAMIGQFKSFGVASIQRTLLAGMQQRDAAALSGTLLMLALGGVAFAVKEKVAGREVSDEPNVWVANALDRSGLLGWLSDANNIAEKFTAGRVGLSAVTGEQITRYQSRNVYGAFLGPTADMVSDLFSISSSGFRGEFSEADLRRMKRLLPFQNLFQLRILFNQFEEINS